MSEETLQLTVEEQAEVRALLKSFAVGTDVTKSGGSQRQSWLEVDIDVIDEAEPGTMVPWLQLTPKTRRYTIVRETRAVFAPYILDKIPITLSRLSEICQELGMSVTTQKSNCTICSLTMCEPIRIFQIETEPTSTGVIITNIIYIV
tara:strand:+ start:356 stop:796 length:441 start_codon:yes stop_codon:yes gene_type:complete